MSREDREQFSARLERVAAELAKLSVEFSEASKDIDPTIDMHESMAANYVSYQLKGVSSVAAKLAKA